MIGLGRFGMTLARELGRSGAQVLAIDKNTTLVNEIKDDVALAVRLDSTERNALLSQEVDKFDVVVVAIGENFEAALLTTVHVRQMQGPQVICRAQTELHAEIFRQIGADDVIQPEMQAGQLLARRLAYEHLEDVIPLAEGFTLIELHAPKSFQGRTLKDLDLRRTYDVNLIAIKRSHREQREGETVESEEVISVPKPDELIREGDRLVLVGTNEALSKLPQE